MKGPEQGGLNDERRDDDALERGDDPATRLANAFFDDKQVVHKIVSNEGRGTPGTIDHAEPSRPIEVSENAPRWAKRLLGVELEEHEPPARRNELHLPEKREKAQEVAPNTTKASSPEKYVLQETPNKQRVRPMNDIVTKQSMSQGAVPQRGTSPLDRKLRGSRLEKGYHASSDGIVAFKDPTVIPTATERDIIRTHLKDRIPKESRRSAVAQRQAIYDKTVNDITRERTTGAAPTPKPATEQPVPAKTKEVVPPIPTSDIVSEKPSETAVPERDVLVDVVEKNTSDAAEIASGNKPEDDVGVEVQSDLHNEVSEAQKDPEELMVETSTKMAVPIPGTMPSLEQPPMSTPALPHVEREDSTQSTQVPGAPTEPNEKPHERVLEGEFIPGKPLARSTEHYHKIRDEYKVQMEQLRAAHEAFEQASTRYKDTKKETSFIGRFMGDLNPEKLAREEAQKKYDDILNKVTQSRYERVEAFKRMRLVRDHVPEKPDDVREDETNSKLAALHIAIIDRMVDGAIKDMELVRPAVAEEKGVGNRYWQYTLTAMRRYSKLPLHKKAAIGAAVAFPLAFAAAYFTGATLAAAAGAGGVVAARRVAAVVTGGTVGVSAGLATKKLVDKAFDAEGVRQEQVTQQTKNIVEGDMDVSEAYKERYKINRRAGYKKMTGTAAGAAVGAGVGYAVGTGTSHVFAEFAPPHLPVPETPSVRNAAEQAVQTPPVAETPTPPAEQPPTVVSAPPSVRAPEQPTMSDDELNRMFRAMGGVDEAPRAPRPMPDHIPEHAPHAGETPVEPTPTGVRQADMLMGQTEGMPGSQSAWLADQELAGGKSQADMLTEQTEGMPGSQSAWLADQEFAGGRSQSDMLMEQTSDVPGSQSAWLADQEIAGGRTQADMLMDQTADMPGSQGDALAGERAGFAEPVPEKEPVIRLHGEYRHGSSVERELQQFLKQDAWVQEHYGNLSPADRGRVAHLLRLQFEKDPSLAEGFKVRRGNWNLVREGAEYNATIKQETIKSVIDKALGRQAAPVQTGTPAAGAMTEAPQTPEVPKAAAPTPEPAPTSPPVQSHAPVAEQPKTVAQPDVQREAVQVTAPPVPESTGGGAPETAVPPVQSLPGAPRADAFPYREPDMHVVDSNLVETRNILKDWKGATTKPYFTTLISHGALDDSWYRNNQVRLDTNWGLIDKVPLASLHDASPGITYEFAGTTIRLNEDVEFYIRDLVRQLERVQGGKALIEQAEQNPNATIADVMRVMSERVQTGDSAGIVRTALGNHPEWADASWGELQQRSPMFRALVKEYTGRLSNEVRSATLTGAGPLLPDGDVQLPAGIEKLPVRAAFERIEKNMELYRNAK